MTWRFSRPASWLEPRPTCRAMCRCGRALSRGASRCWSVVRHPLVSPDVRPRLCTAVDCVLHCRGAAARLHLGERQDVIDCVELRGGRAQGDNISAERAALLLSMPCSRVVQLPPQLPSMLHLSTEWSTASYGISTQEWATMDIAAELEVRRVARQQHRAPRDAQPCCSHRPMAPGLAVPSSWIALGKANTLPRPCTRRPVRSGACWASARTCCSRAAHSRLQPCSTETWWQPTLRSHSTFGAL